MNDINSLYGSHARFDTGRPMTEDEIRSVAPSVFATEAHHSRSARFAPIATIEAIRGLKAEGFEVVGARQAVAKADDRKAFTKHLLRLRRMGDGTKVGDTVAEMLLKNANDGSSVYDLFAGLYRATCLNSMVAQIGTIDSVKVRHSGKDTVAKVIDGTFKVIETAKLALAAPQDWAQLKLDRDERQAFAEAAHVLRFADAEGNVDTPIQPTQMLQIRREADTQPNLWTVFNVIQENTIRGGLDGVHVNRETGRQRHMHTRPINGIDQDVRLNRSLWTLATRMAELKGWKEPVAA